jgi:hypothetical protein
MRIRSDRWRGLPVTLATTALISMASFGMAQQASAATIYVDNNGYGSGSGILTLSFDSNGVGADAFFGSDVNDYAGYGVYSAGVSTEYEYVFEQGGGYGQGQKVKNNAAWANNSNLTDSYTVYYNSGYAGQAEVYYPVDYGFSAGNLDATLKNEEASQYERVYV